MMSTSLLIFTLIGFTFSKRPNIVLILTDDEDQILSGPFIDEQNIMPNRHKIFIENGLSFNNAFASSPTCCVSRSSILTGKYVHNHGVTNNTVPGNCWGDTFQTEQEPFTYAAYLKEFGNYKTFHAGKYLNQYGTSGEESNRIPIGWDAWYSLADEIKYYDYCISNMGKRECYGRSENDYHTTMIKNKAMEFLQDLKDSNNDEPFLLVFSSIGCHSPFTVEPKYEGMDFGIKAPRTPNWNIVAPDGTHHNLLTIQHEMNADIIEQSDEIFSMRLGTLRSVDDAIGQIYNFIDAELNALDETYFIYVSDHGYHDGQWAMSFSKMQLYETDIRIPFYMNGPNIPKGEELNVFASTIDIAPTILDIAGINENEFESNQMDGKSLLEYMDGEQLVDEWQSFLIEYEGEGFDYDSYKPIMSNIMGFAEAVTDGWNNTYSCLRWMNDEKRQSFKYCKFKCFNAGKVETECAEGSVDAKGEFYNLIDDPWEMNNIFDELKEEQHEIIMDRLNAFIACQGDECRGLYNQPVDIDVETTNVQNQHKPFFSFASLLL